MTEQTTESTESIVQKPRLRDRLKRNTPAEAATETKSIKDKVKGAATVLGVVTVAGVVAGVVAKRASKTVDTDEATAVETPEEN